MEYVERKEDALIQTVRTQTQHQLSSVTDSYTPQDKVRKGTRYKGEHSRENKRKMARDENTRTTASNLDEKLVDIEQSYRSLKFVDIKGETESTIVAAQDQAIKKNYIKNKLLKEETDSECRLCKQREATTDHLTYASFWRKMNT